MAVKSRSFKGPSTWVRIPASHPLVPCPWATHSLSFGFHIYKMGAIIKPPGGQLGQPHEMTCTRPFTEHQAQELMVVYHHVWKLVPGKHSAKKEGTAMEDPVPFLGLGKLNWGGDGPLRKSWMGSREAGWRGLSITQQESGRVRTELCIFGFFLRLRGSGGELEIAPPSKMAPMSPYCNSGFPLVSRSNSCS